MSPTVESITSTAKESPNATDALALLAFKQRNDPFNSLSTWNHTLPFCQWQGITCSRRHPLRVVVMNLTGLQLAGPLSPFIANLTFLRAIDLSNNKLIGQIPPEIGRLFRLRYLYLSDNSLEGEIPANLTRCWRLRVINFRTNALIGRIPVELGSLSRLNCLDLAKNNLTGSIPNSLGNLSSLTILFLWRNELEGNIPEELGQIRSLSIFDIQENKLSGTIPPALYNLSSMAIFSVVQNQLHGCLPVDLGITLPNIIRFYVGGNRFTGPIPTSLNNASRLEWLELSANRFTGPIPMNLGRLEGLRFLNLENNTLGSGEVEDMGFLSSLTNCSLLETLSVSGNRLRGALPISIANLSTNLHMLYLGKNQISGSIPSGIGNLFNLISLNMSENFMTGTIPEGIGKMNKLQVLALAINNFSKEFPSFIGNNTQLFVLELAGNNFKGSIPSTLENCRLLSILALSHNNLNGYLSKQIFNITTLRILDLEANSLVGSLPMEVGNLKGLGILIISENKLSGEIPRSLDNCFSLENLHIEGNFFQGTFPSLSSLKGMLQMDISRNNFSGEIPDYVENIRYLEYLNLSYNDFEGEVPQEGIFKNASAVSVIGNKKLCGGSPALLLPACPSHDSKKQKRCFSRRRMIAIIICSVLLLSLLFYYYISKSKKKHPEPHLAMNPLEEQLLQISYGDLSRATDGFSQANLIGVGSYGSVYKGSLDRIGKIVAVKVLNLERRGASKSFIAECRALRNIRHRNLLKIHTVCSSIDSKGDDFKALVFDYMANGNLEQWLHASRDEQYQSKNLTLIQRLNIAVDVASALNYLHNSCQKSIVHCDLKPSNILLDDDMNAHVGDFGLARFLSEATSSCSQNHTNSPGIKGTIGYLAPEYGMGGEVSTFGDIYSYGILLLEMFTGKKPTEEIFNESLSLHQFAKLALPKRAMEIVDQRLLSVEAEALNESQTLINAESKLEMFLISTFKVGVACSMISIKDRMAIGDATVEMLRIRNSYMGVGIHARNN
ncbi:putative LRR receptor-like serine/threonine-protein kinase [Cinnamomum micranthum f. kanehirae]|uniref:non-specific serine/threonine protein kinase n=1 Tax=Cinnamomum micranthum f. kanehirae TaxID=337451 RepID=A0A3S3MVC1_9MAGN|nr:putative LRR receptor-like serine/threonine-protein kinase [Cinnamomum micranthum f. kanehirae]